jgi:RNA-directed DNA polymerase
MDKTKPFGIAKREVWEAYKQVKANQGAAGVDGQSIEQFGEDLGNSLYRLWNRLSSGSYFPPPVRRVDIVVGATTGCWISISRVSSIPLRKSATISESGRPSR